MEASEMLFLTESDGQKRGGKERLEQECLEERRELNQLYQSGGCDVINPPPQSERLLLNNDPSQQQRGLNDTHAAMELGGGGYQAKLASQR